MITSHGGTAHSQLLLRAYGTRYRTVSTDPLQLSHLNQISRHTSSNWHIIRISFSLYPTLSYCYYIAYVFACVFNLFLYCWGFFDPLLLSCCCFLCSNAPWAFCGLINVHMLCYVMLFKHYPPLEFGRVNSNSLDKVSFKSYYLWIANMESN